MPSGVGPMDKLQQMQIVSFALGFGRTCNLRLYLHMKAKKKATNENLADGSAGGTSARLFRSRRRKRR